jgi:hypothetical protein
MVNKGDAGTQCKYYAVCDQYIESNPVDGLCILHSIDATKDADAFAEALATHREHHGDNFTAFVFPGEVDFGGATFSGAASFSGATFSKHAFFSGATFSERANFDGVMFSGLAFFGGATFSKQAEFSMARFSKGAHFDKATFSNGANFGDATFSESANFTVAAFSEGADFTMVTFSEGADFTGVTFSEGANFTVAAFSESTYFTGATFSESADFFGATFGKDANFTGATFSESANFHEATFSGRTLFGGRPGDAQTGRIFAGTAVDFRQVVINPPDVITFLGADLTTCQFLDTDLRKVQLVDVEWPWKRGRVWPHMGRRVLVYDAIAPIETGDGDKRPWSRIERLYRELKQNYEDRRDYERAGDFHYGEKEMRRRNPDTAWGLWLFLTLYRWFSGYGERYLLPLFWAGLLLVGATIGYMCLGLHPKEAELKLARGGAKLALTSWRDRLQGVDYSLRVMTLLKPDDWEPVGYARYIRTFQTLFGPLFLGLFALALRQRLKR